MKHSYNLTVDLFIFRHIYWAEWDSTNTDGNDSRIQRAMSDGSETTVLIDSKLFLPNGLTLDMEGE